MLYHFITQLKRMLGVFFRTFRAFFQRRFVGVLSEVRRLTNFSRHASEMASTSLDTAVTAVAQKPSRREDYVETKRLFISKALIIKSIVTLVIAGLALYFVVWPFLLSNFLTARYYAEDEKLQDWTGRVIVYSDKEKTVPLYAGRLEKGVLQGEGKQYDDNGILIYEGAFVNGIRSGQGREYRDSLLYYQGQFSNGVYEGTGEQYDKNGKPVYQGQFSAGVYNGRGRRFRNGIIRYEGAFADGAEEGMGSSYYSTGRISYKGSFSAGKPDGQGTQYDGDGRTIYTGGFAAGVYSGEGVFYPAEGQELSATFQNNEPAGAVRWKRDGYLYYEGEWSAGGPAGFGQLYNKAGKEIYAGQFAKGTLDGQWLLSLDTEALREALKEGRVETLDNPEGGFLLAARELGLSVLCSYQSAESDSSVHAVFLTPPAGDDWVLLMPEMKNVSYAAASSEVRTLSVPGDYAPPVGVPLAEGSYRCVSDERGEGAVTLLFPENETTAALALWRGAEETLAGLADLSADPAADEAANAKMGALLESLGMVEGDETGAVSADAQNAYYGTAAPGEVLAACENSEKAAEMVDAMLSYWQYAERQAAQEENLARLELLLSDAKAEVSRGGGSDETVLALQEQETTLKGEIQRCATERAKAQLRAQGAGGADLSFIDVSKLAMQFDPTELKVNDLALTAAAYAQAAGKSEEGRDYATEIREILLNLTECYGQMQTALVNYEASAERVQSAASAYATGSGSKAEWYNALSAQADRRAALTERIAGFTGAANRLNTLTGGWVSRTYAWFEAELGKLFEAEMTVEVSPEKAAEAPAEQAEEKASEAPEKQAENKTSEASEKPGEEKTSEAAGEKTADPEPQSGDAQEKADTQDDTAPKREEGKDG